MHAKESIIFLYFLSEVHSVAVQGNFILTELKTAVNKIQENW
jgi:hypothetical protein